MTLLAPRTRHRRRSGAGGLTLIEMVVALGVVMVVLVAAGAAFITVANGQRTAQGNDRAVQLASDQIEVIREVPWEHLGFYSADPGYRATCPTSDCRTTTAEQTVTLQGARPTGSRAPLPLFQPSAATYSNAFTVRVDITWHVDSLPGLPVSARMDNWTNTIGDPIKAGQSSPPDGIPDYASKRVTVTVTWENGSITKKITNSTVRAPALNEAIPSSIGSSTADACDSGVYPFCRLWVTSGQVLNRPVAGVARSSIAVNFHAVTITPVDTGEVVTASWSQANGTTATVSLASTDGGRTWDGAWPRNNVLPIGPAHVTFRTVIGGATQTKVYSDAAWRSGGQGGKIDAAADITSIYGNQYTWLPYGLLTDTTKPAGDFTPITGNEPQSSPAAFCVDANGRTKNFQALMFDVQNIDGQDQKDVNGNIVFKPTVTYTSTTQAASSTAADGSGPGSTVTAQMNPAAISPPTAPGPSGYAGSANGGVVGAVHSGNGSLQRYRFAAGFARGTVLQGDAVFVTISAMRPFDGVTVQRSIRIPVTSAC